MSFWSKHKFPVREDYDTDEEYEEAVETYEYWEYWAIESDG